MCEFTHAPNIYVIAFLHMHSFGEDPVEPPQIVESPEPAASDETVAEHRSDEDEDVPLDHCDITHSTDAKHMDMTRWYVHVCMCVCVRM